MFGIVAVLLMIVRDLDSFSVLGLLPRIIGNLLSYNVTCLIIGSAAFFVQGWLCVVVIVWSWSWL
jgi:hypothetical protein